MELLLFLSALLSSLTGLVAGEGNAMPAGVERGASAIVSATEKVAEAVVARPSAVVAPAAIAEPCEPAFFANLAPPSDPFRASESRLE